MLGLNLENAGCGCRSRDDNTKCAGVQWDGGEEEREREMRERGESRCIRAESERQGRRKMAMALRWV